MRNRVETAWWGLVRFGFRLLYYELAWTYDVVSKVVSLGKWRIWQRTGIAYLNVEPGALILELAHGTGDMQIDLANGGYRTIGLDLSPYMGHLAARKVRRAGHLARLVRGSAFYLPLPDEAFAGVFSTFPTEFFIQSSTLQEVSRVLVPGGRFVIVVNGLLTGSGLVSRLLEWLYRITGQRGPWPEEPLRNFEEAGFSHELIEVNVERSQVLILVATKQTEIHRS